ncbi:hypothetical protein EOM39_01365 [Candidatus Gracilibacteria bacterium]|nr:hypothetical protein [Candidatus Gracilibacteria bacterium]
MSFRNLDNDGDWTFGKGKQNYVNLDKEIMLNIKTRLLSFLGDCFFATDEGIDWWNLLLQKDRQKIIIECKKIINSTPNVRKINSVDYFENEKRQMTIYFNIDTIYSNNLSNEIGGVNV